MIVDSDEVRVRRESAEVVNGLSTLSMLVAYLHEASSARLAPGPNHPSSFSSPFPALEYAHLVAGLGV